MARAGFYNENEYRDYPFQDQSRPLLVLVDASGSSAGDGEAAALPESAIVDFGAIMGVTSAFDAATCRVYLYRISRVDPYFVYEFRTDATGAAEESLTFVRNWQMAGEFASDWAASRPIGSPDPLPASASSSASDSASSSASDSASSASAGSSASASSSSSASWGPYPFCHESPPPPPTCVDGDCDTPAWEGFLVTGLFDELRSLLLDGQTIIYDSRVWIVEPARLQNLAGTFVRSVNLANAERTRVTLPDECSATAEDTGRVFPQAVCLQGDLIFREGFNCTIRQDTANGALTFSGVVGGGAGEACDEVPTHPGEQRPSGSRYYSGGPACADIVRTINGKSARRLRISAGPGFRIEPHPTDPHTLVVTATLEDFAGCAADPAAGSSC